MNADKILRLEKNRKFRRKIYAKDIWKNYAVIPPALILFTGLFGLLFLFNSDHLVSLATIPFVVMFVLGTIWLKAVRKYLLDELVSEDKRFAICLAIPLMKKNGKTIMIFSANNNRLNKYYLEKEKKEILGRINDSDCFIPDFGKKTLQVIPDTDIYVISPSSFDRILNKNKTSSVDRYVIFDALGKVRYTTLREMESFL